MKKLILLCLLIISSHCLAVDFKVDSLEFGKFGKVKIYRPTATASKVILFASGDGGWNKGVVDMAKSFASTGCLVVGYDVIHFLKQLDTSAEKCSYPAGDLEALSQFVQRKLDLPMYITPVLVGYSSGATLVYATIVQAPPNTFAGAISMGFCPDLEVTKPFCKGYGLEFSMMEKPKGLLFEPASNLEEPWVAFQGTIDQVCSADTVESFVKRVKGAKLVLLPKVGHGFSVEKNWLPQLKQALSEIVVTDTISTAGIAQDVRDLPLVEVPAAHDSINMLAVIISGDGGWASIDKSLGEYFASHGISVVGLNSLKYFWSRKTPDGAGVDLLRIVTHYRAAWKKDKVLLVGYSRGADVLPFMANRLPKEILTHVKGVALLGLDKTIDFKFHISELLFNTNSENELPVKPEIEKLKGTHLICFYGADEDHSLCRDLDTSWVQIVQTGGGHHFGGDYITIAKRILENVTKAED